MTETPQPSASKPAGFAAFSRVQGGRSYDLGKMTYGQLWAAFLTYPTVLAYFALIAALTAGAVWQGALATPVRTLIAMAAAIILYPLVWYGLHRWVLHNTFLYKHPWTASLWKRIHFDHHQDPHRMDVLFGSLTNTLPTVLGISVGVGWLIGGWGPALAAGATGLAFTCVYEFLHCIQHLNFQPQHPWLKRIKKLHMAHHFHNETGNFGIISFWPDRLFGTLYEEARAKPRSRTVHNLGYDGAEAERYPWVGKLTVAKRGSIKN